MRCVFGFKIGFFFESRCHRIIHKKKWLPSAIQPLRTLVTLAADKNKHSATIAECIKRRKEKRNACRTGINGVADNESEIADCDLH